MPIDSPQESAMTMTDLEETVLHLPTDQRAALAMKLLESLETLDEAEFDKAWGEESARRIAASGGRSIPGDEVAAQARALLR